VTASHASTLVIAAVNLGTLGVVCITVADRTWHPRWERLGPVGAGLVIVAGLVLMRLLVGLAVGGLQ
jgi:hypothetical protein